MSNYWNKGQNDAQQGKGPQDTRRWPWQARQGYDAGYNGNKR